MSKHPLTTRLIQHLNHLQLPDPIGIRQYGTLVRVTGLMLEVEGLEVPLGARCLVASAENTLPIEAEVVGFAEQRLFLMPVAQTMGLKPGARVWQRQHAAEYPSGKALLGRVIDALGEPLDGKGPLFSRTTVRLERAPLNPILRQPIETPLDVGIRAINGLLTLGQGQRVGLIAGTGVGKSVLLGMIARFTEAEVVVVGLIGERGREVNEFVRHNLGEEGLKKSIVIAAPADAPPLMRLQGAQLATALAEDFRDKGYKVLLLMDSLTRYAQAQREIALSIGEPPASKGYPPSVFTKIPQLVERAGNSDVPGGSLTAIYTVLAEGDDTQDPVVDAARGVLDGHIVLSRALAERGQYPAIDIEQSVSRVMVDIVPKQQLELTRQFRQLYSTYEENRDLITLGVYRRGSDPNIDRAIQKMPALRQFLQQDMHEQVDLSSSQRQLAEVVR